MQELQDRKNEITEELKQIEMEMLRKSTPKGHSLFERVTAMLLFNDFERFTEKEGIDKEMWFKKGDLVLFVCPHICKMVAFYEYVGFLMPLNKRFMLTFSPAGLDYTESEAHLTEQVIKLNALNFKL